MPPPPGEVLDQGLSDWERWVHADSDLNPIVKVAMAHYQFEALHPFTDGNGRIGRLLAILQLIEAELLPEPLINLSPYFEQRADEYRYRLRSVSTEGDIDGWVQFFCKALANQATEAGDRIRQLLEWRDTTIAELRSKRHKGTTITIVESPIMTGTDRHVTGGVDTHHDFHVAAVLDSGTARLLDTATFDASTAGYIELWAWMCGQQLVFRAI